MAITSFKGDYDFLSNFYPCEVMWEGLKYPSTENAYQAAKSQDVAYREVFQRLPSGQAKKLGKKIVLRPDWERIKLDVMLELVRLKFSQEPLRAMLLDTRPHGLVEGNYWHDNFYGNCSCAKCKTIKGLNKLGEILMAVREELSHV